MPARQTLVDDLALRDVWDTNMTQQAFTQVKECFEIQQGVLQEGTDEDIKMNKMLYRNTQNSM